MTHAENFAIGQWLNDYPEDKTYEEIIDMMVGSAYEDDEWVHEEITVWQTVEHFTLRQVAEFIEETKQHFENTIKAMKAEGAFE
jgi:hypothetical protein